MQVSVSAKKLSGKVAAVASKSHMHRLLICAALSGGPAFIPCAALSNDIRATAGCLAALGLGVEYAQGGFAVSAKKQIPGVTPLLDCGESGSTYRFLTPLACALGCGARFKLSGKLAQRPMDGLWDALEAHGAIISGKGSANPAVRGRIAPGRYEIAGNVSSQYISGLMFALPLLDGGSQIVLRGGEDSSGYIAMTRDVLRLFSVDAAPSSEGYTLAGNQKYITPAKTVPEGDWSNAAFWLCAAAAGGGTITVGGLSADTAQGDSAVKDILARFGARIVFEDGAVCASGGLLKGITIDAGDIPDLVPPLALTAAAAQGTTVFENAQRLRLKESDRMASVCGVINGLGGEAFCEGDALVVRGKGRLRGGKVHSHNDHRIAMLAACASVICEGDVDIADAQAVEKSYPAFFTDFAALGGEVKGA